jgi:hypothetical protein
MESIHKMRLSVLVLSLLVVYASGECFNQCEKANSTAGCVMVNCSINCGSDRFSMHLIQQIRIYNSTNLCKATYPTLDYKINLNLAP